MSTPDPQPSLLDVPVPARRRRARPAVPPAERRPVAVVAVDRSSPHLDRPFEYLVPAPADEAARPGCRVRVRFGHQDLDGYLIERRDHPEHDGTLQPLRRVVSDEQVLTPTVLDLCRRVARRWAGTLPDVLRLAVPPRHARTEKEQWAPGHAGDDAAPSSGGRAPLTPEHLAAWAPYPHGAAYLRRVAAGEAPRAV
ncbi:primosomal protein N' family DNA-binding protein, partial [Cellulomonas bogoriensis]